MSKIVILGSSGQLGSDLRKVFATTEHQIISPPPEEVDALDAKVADRLSAYADAGYIINCIAATNVDGCETSPGSTFIINSAFVTILAKFCQEHDITLIHISTDYVFDGNKSSPYLETDQPNPLNVYGLSKYAGELAVTNYSSKFFILRVSSLFGLAGAEGKGGNFVTTMLRLAREKDSWNVINDQLTCPTHTLDVARAILALIEQKIANYGVYHCVNSGSCSWFEFTQLILHLSGLDPNKVKPISYREYSFKAIRPQYGIMDNNKLGRYYLLPDYKQALSEYLDLIGVTAQAISQ